MQVGDIIEDTYKSFGGITALIARGIVTKMPNPRDYKYQYVEYFCIGVKASKDAPDTACQLVGTTCVRADTNMRVMSSGGIVGKNGS